MGKKKKKNQPITKVYRISKERADALRNVFLKGYEISDLCIQEKIEAPKLDYRKIIGNVQNEKPVEEDEDKSVESFKSVLNELEHYDSMLGGDPNLYPAIIERIFKSCFMMLTTDSNRIKGLFQITGIARCAYQGYAEVALSMDEISQEQLDTYRQKNADYGNAFEKSMDEDGILVAKIRIGDKIRRIQSLIKNNGERKVKDEKLEDTYLDLANYCVMTILWLRKQK